MSDLAPTYYLRKTVFTLERMYNGKSYGSLKLNNYLCVVGIKGWVSSAQKVNSEKDEEDGRFHKQNLHNGMSPIPAECIVLSLGIHLDWHGSKHIPICGTTQT